ncbi:hypothetical protein [Klebsiella aerogenes]|uniref:hypothetical protein n=1 Tax=Klebsiella aerogenes TaxID=548 RepID=UPI001CC399A9|nr:hypothetical protein [Klebsiella aerogenes]UNX75767.1 hypothetical protein MQE09_10585 [Klebsiella aerogenes]
MPGGGSAHPAYGSCGLPLIYSPRCSPGGAAAFPAYGALRFGSPEKAQRAASGKTP